MIATAYMQLSGFALVVVILTCIIIGAILGYIHGRDFTRR